ncbi:hypothetical protein [Azorhizophilus paspali]|uniref:DUF1488 domain-containing protein n=1 Tax=Azorhizophilus paspali TaxID=69963 RepID=A0ABV6SJ32_AZOPA
MTSPLSRRFQVRDISAQYSGPTFDLIFHDTESKVIRYSEAIWDSEALALAEADRLEKSQAHPVHWDAC